jgi:hypothetical protein
MVGRKPPFLLALILVFAIGAGDAQTTLIVQQKVSVSRALAGHVDIGITNTPAKGISVDLCSSDWKTIFASTKTDDDGYFSLRAPMTAGLYYIRLSAPGVNPYQMRVRLRKNAPGELRIHLSVAS